MRNTLLSPDSGTQNSIASFVASSDAKYVGIFSGVTRRNAVIVILSPAQIILLPVIFPGQSIIRKTSDGIRKSPSAQRVKSVVHVAKRHGYDAIRVSDIVSNNVRANWADAVSSDKDWIGASPSFSNAIEHMSIFVSIIAPINNNHIIVTGSQTV